MVSPRVQAQPLPEHPLPSEAIVARAEELVPECFLRAYPRSRVHCQTLVHKIKQWSWDQLEESGSFSVLFAPISQFRRWQELYIVKILIQKNYSWILRKELEVLVYSLCGEWVIDTAGNDVSQLCSLATSQRFSLPLNLAISFMFLQMRCL